MDAEAKVKIRPKNPASRWVALDVNNKIIGEGRTPDDAKREAKKIAEVFFLMHVPEKGVTYFL